jgi:hypothetical protein
MKKIKLCGVVLIVLWMSCSNALDDRAAVGNAEDGTNQEEETNQEEDYIDYTDTSVAPAVAADPGDAADAVLVPDSKDVSSLALASAVLISFDDEETPTVSGTVEGVAVSADTNHVVVTLTGAGANIVVQGVSDAGSLTFSGNFAFNLYLNGVGLTNEDGGAISNGGTGKMTATLVEGTKSRLIDGAGSKGAFYSKGDFALGGSGTLEVRGKITHAIKTGGAFSQTGGTIIVKEAVKDGVNASTTVNISGGSFTSRTMGDGIQGDEGVTITGGAFNIITTADDLKAHGVKSDADIVIGGASSASPTMTITVYGDGSKCVSADGDLTVYSGTLTLNTAGNGYWDTGDEDNADKTSACSCLKADGNVIIDGGVLTMLSTGTGGKGISAKGDITINGGTLDVTTTGKTYTYSAAYDKKSKAIKSDNNLSINAGTITIKTYTDGGEGLECEYTLTIAGGTIVINSYDDAINASGGDSGTGGKIVITGGNIFCNASGNDGIDSNGTLTISGGTVIAMGAVKGEDGFDCDNNTFTVTGGTLIGMGGSTSKPTASTTSVSTVECNVSASAVYHIESSAGAEIMTFKPPRNYSGTVCLLFGGGNMERDASYTLYTGGTVSGGTNFHGLYSGGSYTKGAAVGTFTAAAYATVGTASGSPGPGGQPGTPGAPPHR